MAPCWLGIPSPFAFATAKISMTAVEGRVQGQLYAWVTLCSQIVCATVLHVLVM